MSVILSQLGKLVVLGRKVCPLSDLIIVVERNRYLSCLLTTIYCCQASLSSQVLCIDPPGLSLAEPKWRWNRSPVQSALADSRRFSSTEGLDFYFVMFKASKHKLLLRFSHQLQSFVCFAIFLVSGLAKLLGSCMRVVKAAREQGSLRENRTGRVGGLSFEF